MKQPTIEDLRAENAALLDLLSVERANNDDLRAALAMLAAPVIEPLAHRFDSECGFIDQASLNI